MADYDDGVPEDTVKTSEQVNSTVHFIHTRFNPAHGDDDNDSSLYADCVICGRIFYVLPEAAFAYRNNLSLGLACRDCSKLSDAEIKKICQVRLEVINNRLERFDPSNLTENLIEILFSSAYTHSGKSQSQKENEGFVYLLGSPEGYCKIGRTRNLTQRLLQIGLQLPFRVELLHSFKSRNCIATERNLHKRFAHARKNGEWFLLSPQEIGSILELQDE